MSERLRESGAAFSLDLSDAIEQATADAATISPDLFALSGIELSHAVERETFIRLVNDPALAAAHARAGGRVAVRDRFEAHVVQLLVPKAAVVVSARHRLRAFVRPVVRATRLRAPKSSRGTFVRGRPFWLAVHHSKFVPFAAPVIRAVGAGRVGILSLSSEVTAAALERRYAVRQLDPSPTHGGMRDLCGRPHLADQFLAVRDELAQANARAVVVFEGNAPSDEVVSAAARSLGIPSLCIQHGWASITNVGFRNMRHSAFAVWGEGFAELLRPYNPNQEFAVTGNPVLDAGVSRPPHSAEVKHGAGILFALQTVAPTISLEAMSEFVSLVAAAATALPDVPMLVREHPGHPIARLGLTLPEAPNLVFVHPRDIPLLDALAAAFAVVSISSTTLLEGIALLRPAVVFESTPDLRYSPDVAAWGAGVHVSSVPAAIEALRRLSEPRARGELLVGMKSFREHFFAGAQGDASVRVAEVLETLA